MLKKIVNKCLKWKVRKRSPTAKSIIHKILSFRWIQFSISSLSISSQNWSLAKIACEVFSWGLHNLILLSGIWFQSELVNSSNKNYNVLQLRVPKVWNWWCVTCHCLNIRLSMSRLTSRSWEINSWIFSSSEATSADCKVKNPE